MLHNSRASSLVQDIYKAFPCWFTIFFKKYKQKKTTPACISLGVQFTAQASLFACQMNKFYIILQKVVCSGIANWSFNTSGMSVNHRHLECPRTLSTV